MAYSGGAGDACRKSSLLFMWRLFRTTAAITVRLPYARAAGLFSAVAAASLISAPHLRNDASPNLEGVQVDNAIDPFPVTIGKGNLPVSSEYTLIASGVRSVTFIGFKVYGAGMYVSKKDEGKIAATIRKYTAQTGKSVADVLNDKEVSQQIVDEIATSVPYALRITPVRNTDFGHLKDGLTKSILASPMAKTMREEVATGLEQLRKVFSGFKGSVPKNHDLWVVSNTREVSINYDANTDMGVITEPCIARVVLVLYLSNARVLSEPLRKSFVAYAERLV